LQVLLQDELPVLFEGVHTCFYANHKALINRKKIIRAHNVEHQYYAGLMKSERNLLKKMYYFIEQKRLYNFELNIDKSNMVAAIGSLEFDFFRAVLGDTNCELIPCFHDYASNIDHADAPNTDDFILYHGNLSVAENIDAACYLIDIVKNTSEIKLVIAGKNPSDLIIEKCKNKAVTLIANPSDKQLSGLIATAKANILITHQSTGVKLKLLHVLHKNKSIIANETMLKGTPFFGKIRTYNSPNEIKKALLLLDATSDNELEITTISALLEKHYNPLKNAQKIINYFQINT
jgi:hypothetical protein